MKKTKIILLVLLIWAMPSGAMCMESMFRNGVLHFDYKKEDLAPAEAAARQQLEKDKKISTKQISNI